MFRLQKLLNAGLTRWLMIMRYGPSQDRQESSVSCRAPAELEFVRLPSVGGLSAIDVTVVPAGAPVAWH